MVVPPGTAFSLLAPGKEKDGQKESPFSGGQVVGTSPLRIYKVTCIVSELVHGICTVKLSRACECIQIQKENLTYTPDIIRTDPVLKSQILTGEPDAITSPRGRGQSIEKIIFKHTNCSRSAGLLQTRPSHEALGRG